MRTYSTRHRKEDGTSFQMSRPEPTTDASLCSHTHTFHQLILHSLPLLLPLWIKHLCLLPCTLVTSHQLSPLPYLRLLSSQQPRVILLKYLPWSCQTFSQSQWPPKPWTLRSWLLLPFSLLVCSSSHSPSAVLDVLLFHRHIRAIAFAVSPTYLSAWPSPSTSSSGCSKYH